jgi:hypothetical protein
MEDRTPHYLRFARALALATTIALPACSDGDVSDASEEESSPGGPVATSTTAPGTGGSAGTGTGTGTDIVKPPVAPPIATATSEPPDAGADANPYYGKSSGPLPPPEMPASIV